MESYSIESLQPIGGGFWKAVVQSKHVEDIEDREFGQEAIAIVRFKYHHDGSAAGLLEAAYHAAKRTLSLGIDAIP